MSKYSAIIKEARKPEISKAIIQDNSTEEMVNLCIKVPLSWRRHWAGESKKKGVSMTTVIIEALNAKFEPPPSQN